MAHLNQVGQLRLRRDLLLKWNAGNAAITRCLMLPFRPDLQMRGRLFSTHVQNVERSLMRTVSVEIMIIKKGLSPHKMLIIVEYKTLDIQ